MNKRDIQDWAAFFIPGVPCPEKKRANAPARNPGKTSGRRCSVCKAVGHDKRRHARRNPSSTGYWLIQHKDRRGRWTDAHGGNSYLLATAREWIADDRARDGGSWRLGREKTFS